MLRVRWQSLRALFGSSDAAEIGRFSTQLKNIGHLLTGNFLSAVVAIAAMGLAARAIGPGGLGVLALGMALTMAVERFLGFQTWQPLIRYGGGLPEERRAHDYRKLVKIAVLLDLCTAFFGWLLATGIILFGREKLGWSEEAAQSGLIYACVLLTAINGAPVGILRLAGRFKDVAYRQVVANTVRFVFAALGLHLGWGLIAFTVIWAGTTMLSAILLIAAALRELARDRMLDFYKAPLKGLSETFEGFWKFTIGANLSLMVRSAPQQLDTLLVGALTGTEAAGFYHIAKRFGKFAEQAGQQVQAVVYPDIAKLWALAKIDQIRRVFLRTEITMAILCLLGVGFTYLFAPMGVRLLAGAQFSPASQLVVLQIIAVSLMLIGSTARSGALSAGRTNALLALSTLTTVVFFAVAAPLVAKIGPMGANVAHIAQQAVFVVGVMILFKGAFSKLQDSTKDRDTR